MNRNSELNTSGNILIVDDTPENLLLLSSILSKQGYEVRKVINGQMALKTAQAAPPDLILLDIMMPQMNGYEVCSHLKASESTQEIPVIFLSAMSDVLDKVKAFNIGGADYITKPFQAEEVLVRVKNQLTLQQQKEQLIKSNLLLQQEIEKRQKIEAILFKANQKLENLAALDGLTQISNRRRFDECLAQEWRRLAREQLPLSLILIDVDYFKLYNDSYGHQAGDECLQKVAGAISQNLKRPADIAARYGGEEFAVILPNTNAEGAWEAAKLIQQSVEKLQLVHKASEVSEHITLSMGVSSMVPDHQKTEAILIAAADQAVYEAKEKGRNKIVRC